MTVSGIEVDAVFMLDISTRNRQVVEPASSLAWWAQCMLLKAQFWQSLGVILSSILLHVEHHHC